MSETSVLSSVQNSPIIAHCHKGWIKTVIKTQTFMKMNIVDRKANLKLIEKTFKMNSNGIGCRKKMSWKLQAELAAI